MTMRSFDYGRPGSVDDVIAALGAAPTRDAVRPWRVARTCSR